MTDGRFGEKCLGCAKVIRHHMAGERGTCCAVHGFGPSCDSHLSVPLDVALRWASSAESEPCSHEAWEETGGSRRCVDCKEQLPSTPERSPSKVARDRADEREEAEHLSQKARSQKRCDEPGCQVLHGPNSDSPIDSQGQWRCRYHTYKCSRCGKYGELESRADLLLCGRCIPLYDLAAVLDDAARCAGSVVRNFARDLEENQDRVSELLEANTRLLDERRAIDRRYMVRHFMRMAEHPLPEEPCVPPEERVRFRMKLIMEEFVELLEAIWRDFKEEGDSAVEFTHPLVAQIQTKLQELLQIPMDVDLVAWTDATVDLDYVVEGARNEFGIDGNKVWAEVHRANMDKFEGEKVYDESGLKILKPEGWKPPDIEGVLRKQGWRG